ncbi:MAG: hypothetical protein ACLRLX_06220, partial [Anaerovoracaceae bacterium]
ANAAIAGLAAGEIVFAIGIFLSNSGDSSICALVGIALNIFLFTAVSMLDNKRIKVYKKIESYKREYKLKDY